MTLVGFSTICSSPKMSWVIAVACNKGVRATDKIKVNIARKNYHATPYGCDMTKQVLETLYSQWEAVISKSDL